MLQEAGRRAVSVTGCTPNRAARSLVTRRADAVAMVVSGVPGAACPGQLCRPRARDQPQWHESRPSAGPPIRVHRSAASTAARPSCGSLTKYSGTSSDGKRPRFRTTSIGRSVGTAPAPRGAGSSRCRGDTWRSSRTGQPRCPTIRRTCRGSRQEARPVSRRSSSRWSAAGSLLLRVRRAVAPEVVGSLGPPALDLRQPFRRQSGRRLRERRMDAENVFREPAAENRGDVSSPVAAIGYELAVAEPSHEFHPCGRDLFRPPPGGGRLVAVTEARQRRDHDAERRRVRIFRIRQLDEEVLPVFEATVRRGPSPVSVETTRVPGQGAVPAPEPMTPRFTGQSLQRRQRTGGSSRASARMRP